MYTKLLSKKILLFGDENKDYMNDEDRDEDEVGDADEDGVGDGDERADKHDNLDSKFHADNEEEEEDSDEDEEYVDDSEEEDEATAKQKSAAKVGDDVVTKNQVNKIENGYVVIGVGDIIPKAKVDSKMEDNDVLKPLAESDDAVVREPVYTEFDDRSTKGG